MPRRSNGEGSVAKRPNGTWVAKLWVGGKRRHLYGKTRVEVVTKLRVLQNEVASGAQAEPTRMTVSEYLRFWVDASKPSLRASTVALYETLVRLYVSPGLERLGSRNSSQSSCSGSTTIFLGEDSRRVPPNRSTDCSTRHWAMQ
jgi:hypothetical protein